MNLNVEIKLSYFYDRPFYFIHIEDKNKIVLNLNMQISDNKRISHIKSFTSKYSKIF